MTRNECLEILELPSGASKADIVKAYRQLAQVWHPDRFPNNVDLQQKANAKLAKINDAYQALRDGKFSKEKKARKKAPVDEWFYAIDGVENGPIKASELIRLATSGVLKPDDLVWKDGFPEWVPARQIKGLNDAFSRPKPSAETIDISTGPVPSFRQSNRLKFPAYIAGLMAILIVAVLLMLWNGRKPQSTELLVDRHPIQLEPHTSKEKLNDKGSVVGENESPNESRQNAAAEHEVMTAVTPNVKTSDVTLPGDTAINFDNTPNNFSESTSESESQSLDTASAKVAEVTYLDDLKEVSFSTGFGILGKHGLTGYEPTHVQHIRLRSDPAHEILHGLSFCPKGTISKLLKQKGDPVAHVAYKLDKQYLAFRGTAAINFPIDEDGMANALKANWKGKAETPIIFRILGDSKVLWESRPLQGHGDSQDCEIAIEGVDELRLEVACEGAENFAWSFWANPRVSNQDVLELLSKVDSSSLTAPEAIPKKIREYFERSEHARSVQINVMNERIDLLQIAVKNAVPRTLAEARKHLSDANNERGALKAIRRPVSLIPLPMEVGDIGFLEVLEQILIIDKKTIIGAIWDHTHNTLHRDEVKRHLSLHMKQNSGLSYESLMQEAEKRFIVFNVDTAKIPKIAADTGWLQSWRANALVRVIAMRPDEEFLGRFPERFRGKLADHVLLELVKPADIEKYRDMFYNTKAKTVDNPISDPSKTDQGYPSIKGFWQETPEIVFEIIQQDERFTATTSYKFQKTIEIKAIVEGKISREGKIEATFHHTKAPENWKKEQKRTGQLSADSKSIRGLAVWEGGKHEFVWTLKK